MADLKKVSKAKLKEAVNKIAPQLSEDAVFVAGARNIKDDQIEIEFVQNRNVGGRAVSLLAVLNEGDKRFNTGRFTMRVWSIVSALGFNNSLKSLGISFEEIQKACNGLTDDQRVAVLTPVTEITINGVTKPVKIACLETVDIEELPKSIRELMQDPEGNPDYQDRYRLQTPQGVKIVDAHGQQVYRRFELSTGERADILVEGKQLITDYNKGKGKSASTKDVLKSLAGSLTD
jgi:hypothetical protein